MGIWYMASKELYWFLEKRFLLDEETRERLILSPLRESKH